MQISRKISLFSELFKAATGNYSVLFLFFGFSSSLSAENFFRAQADSTVSSGAGLGLDYPTSFEHFLLGVGVGVGSFEEAYDTRLQGNFSLGIQTSFVGRPRFYIHYFQASLGQEIWKDDLEFSFRSFGAHAQWDLIPKAEWAAGAFRWGGIAFSSGIKYSRTRLLYSAQVEEGFSVDSYSAQIQGDLLAESRVNIVSVPVDLSTSFLYTYYLNFYAVLGADFNVGTSVGNLGFSGPATLRSADTALDQKKDLAAQLDALEEPKLFMPRTTFGAQVELGHGAIFGQWVNYIDSKASAFQFGLKAFF